MLAEKRFDQHFHSARRAVDALDLLSDADAKRMRSASTLNELLIFVEEMESPSEDFARWQTFFTANQDDASVPGIVEALAYENSMVGWTAANVLKRLRLDDELLSAILSAAERDRAVVRWRAVHAMGGFAIDKFIDALSDRLDNDPDENVRYGALRSMIEIASREPSVLPVIVDMLIGRLDTIARSPRVLGELSRAVFLNKSCAPSGWVQEISRVFYCLLERSDDRPGPIIGRSLHHDFGCITVASQRWPYECYTGTKHLGSSLRGIGGKRRILEQGSVSKNWVRDYWV